MALQMKPGTCKTSVRRRDPCEDTPDKFGERFVYISTVPIPSTGNASLDAKMGDESLTVDVKGV